MNYCEKIHYTILSTKRAEFAVMVDDLLSQIASKRGDHETGLFRYSGYE